MYFMGGYSRLLNLSTTYTNPPPLPYPQPYLPELFVLIENQLIHSTITMPLFTHNKVVQSVRLYLTTFWDTNLSKTNCIWLCVAIYTTEPIIV